MNVDTRTNLGLSQALSEYAALLELSGADYYATRAYRKAAELVAGLPVPVVDLVTSGRIRELRGIGPGIEARLRELVTSGTIAELEQLRLTVSPELAAFGRLHGFTAKRFVEIGAALNIQTVAELQRAAEAGELRQVRGIGPRIETRIRDALKSPPRPRGSQSLSRARKLTEEIAAALGGEPAGDARRYAASPQHLAVVVPTDSPETLRARFAALPQIAAVIGADLGLTLEGTPIELVPTAPASLGTALLRATGPAHYVAALGPLPEAATEESLYHALDLPYLPPELRELPASAPVSELVDSAAIRGDLHCHSIWSDGKATVLEMAVAAQALGYEYVAICDHTPNVRVVPGLDADALRRQAIEIQAANDLLAPFRVLRGVECDILPNGNLDLPDDILCELDWVQISVHAGQRTPRKELTARVIHAMQHPAARCLSHPTGRIIGHRPENKLDLEKTIETALATGVALEVNGLPDRLDLDGHHVRTVIEAGANIVCASDSHSTAGLDNMHYAVATARRGNASRKDVVNTKPLDDVLLPRGHPRV